METGKWLEVSTLDAKEVCRFEKEVDDGAGAVAIFSTTGIVRNGHYHPYRGFNKFLAQPYPLPRGAWVSEEAWEIKRALKKGKDQAYIDQKVAKVRRNREEFAKECECDPLATIFQQPNPHPLEQYSVTSSIFPTRDNGGIGFVVVLDQSQQNPTVDVYGLTTDIVLRRSDDEAQLETLPSPQAIEDRLRQEDENGEGHEEEDEESEEGEEGDEESDEESDEAGREEDKEDKEEREEEAKEAKEDAGAEEKNGGDGDSDGGSTVGERVSVPANFNIIQDYGEFTSLIRRFEQPERVFIGLSPLNEMTQFSGGHGPDFNGNSFLLLIASTPASSYYQYAHIGTDLFTFTTTEPIHRYVSSVGNNCVPYPFAESAHWCYAMLSRQKTPIQDHPQRQTEGYVDFMDHAHYSDLDNCVILSPRGTSRSRSEGLTFDDYLFPPNQARCMRLTKSASVRHVRNSACF